MRTDSPRRRYLYSACLAVAVILLTACGLNSALSTPARQTETVNVPAPAVPTQLSTETPAPPLAILLAPAGADPTQAGALEAAMKDLASSSGMQFEVRKNLATGDVTSAWRVVVVLPPFGGLAQLSAAAPQAQFVGVGIEGLQPGGNLSVIGPQGWREDQQAFLAGLIAAVVTNDWRAGMISPIGAPKTDVLEAAFRNGAHYFCGLCNPSTPPFVPYPVVVEIDPAAGEAGWKATVDGLLAKGAKTVYLPPQASSEELLSYLAQAKVGIIGGGQPAAEISSAWVASVGVDPAGALRSLWPDLVAGKGGANLPMAVGFSDAQVERFSPGRQKAVQAILDDLLAGRILPVTPPNQ
jgi:hypothetical protein